jgi:hypothetical protein
MDMNTNGSRASLSLAALLLAAVAACPLRGATVPSGAPTYTYYVLGRFETWPVEKLLRDEEWAKRGHMPWRTEPALVAAYLLDREAMPPLPRGAEARVEETQRGAWLARAITAPGVEVAFEVAQEQPGAVAVDMMVNGEPKATIHLERPFGYWWYITSVVTADGAVSRLPAGTVQWVSMREALTPRGFRVSWSARDRAAIAVNGRSRVELGVGNRAVRMNGKTSHLAATPQILVGRLIVPQYLVADVMSKDAAVVASSAR